MTCIAHPGPLRGPVGGLIIINVSTKVSNTRVEIEDDSLLHVVLSYVSMYNIYCSVLFKCCHHCLTTATKWTSIPYKCRPLNSILIRLF